MHASFLEEKQSSAPRLHGNCNPFEKKACLCPLKNEEDFKRVVSVFMLVSFKG